jgi:hypothetical protein
VASAWQARDGRARQTERADKLQKELRALLQTDIATGAPRDGPAGNGRAYLQRLQWLP